MTPRESVIAVLVRHAEWCLDQADPAVVRDLPAWQRKHHAEVAVEIAATLALISAREDAEGIMARLHAMAERRRGP